MSEEEEEKEESENEDEEKEESENEDEEKEEEENEEEEEGEDKESDEEEGEEDEDDDKKKKKKAKGKNKGKDKGKDKEKDKDKKKSDEKKEGANEINIEANKDSFMSLAPTKSILQIISEINLDLDVISKKIDTTMPVTNYQNYNINSITSANALKQSLDQEDYEIKRLIDEATQMTNQMQRKGFENKCIQSDDEDEIEEERKRSFYAEREKAETQRQEKYHEQYRNKFPYDPDKYKDYYVDLKNRQPYREKNFEYDIGPQQRFARTTYGGNFNSNYNTYNTNNTDYYQGSRIKKMDELYRGNNFRRVPMVYAQPESQPLPFRPPENGYQNDKPKNFGYNNNYGYNNGYNRPVKTELYQVNNNPNKPFERFRPGSISQAMDILLDKK